MLLTWGKQQNHSDNGQQRPHPAKMPCELNEPRRLSIRLDEAKTCRCHPETGAKHDYLIDIGHSSQVRTCYLVGFTSEMTRGLDGASSHSIHVSRSSIVSKNRQSLYSSSVVSSISPTVTSSRGNVTSLPSNRTK